MKTAIRGIFNANRYEIYLVFSIYVRKNKGNTLSYFLVTIPLYVSYLSLIFLSFGNHSGNIWWFGMRRDFCELFLLFCPMFQIYGNIQVKLSSAFKAASSHDSAENISNEFRPAAAANQANTNASALVSPAPLGVSNSAADHSASSRPLLNASDQVTATPVVVEPAETRRALAQLIDNDVASNEASLLKFSLLQQMRTTAHSGNPSNSANEDLNLSLDLNETSSMCMTAPSGYAYASSTSRSSSKRVKNDPGGDANGVEAASNGEMSTERVGPSKKSQKSEKSHRKTQSCASQVYFVNTSANKDTLLIKQLANTTGNTTSSSKPVQTKQNCGNFVRLDMPD